MARDAGPPWWRRIGLTVDRGDVHLVLVLLVIGCFTLSPTRIFGGPPERQIVTTLILCVSLAGAESDASFSCLWREKWMGLFVLTCAVSPLWGAPDARGLVNLYLLVLAVVGACCTAAWFPAGFHLRLLLGAGILTAVLSAISLLVDPVGSIGREAPFLGMWRGIYLSKIGLGEASSLTCLTALLAASESKGGNRNGLLAVALLSAVLMAGSHSITAVAAVGAGLVAVTPLLPSVRQRPKTTKLVLVLIGAWLVILSVTLASLWRANVAETGAGAATLHERVTILEYAWTKGCDHFVLGTGYNGLWHGWSNHWALGRFMVPHAHNVLMEIWLQTGLFGAGTLLISLVRAAMAAAGRGMPWPLAGLVFCMVHGATDSYPPDTSMLPFVFALCVFAAHCGSRTHAEPA